MSTKKCLCSSQKYLKYQAKRTRSTVFARHYPSWNRHMYIEVDKYLKSQGSKKGWLLGKGENCPVNSLHCLCIPHRKALRENSVDQKWDQGEAKNVEFVESFIGARNTSFNLKASLIQRWYATKMLSCINISFAINLASSQASVKPPT
jgi:hypothetical protein